MILLLLQCCLESILRVLNRATISGKTEGSGVKVSVIKFNFTELIKLKEKKVRNVLVQPGLS